MLWRLFADKEGRCYGHPAPQNLPFGSVDVYLGHFISVCSPKPLGMENGAIFDSQLTASSWTVNAKDARLNYPRGAWVPNLGPGQWLQIDLLDYHTSVTSVATQGRSLGYRNQWVTTYKLQFNNSDHSFKYFKEEGKNEDKVKYRGDNLVRRSYCVTVTEIWVTQPGKVWTRH